VVDVTDSIRTERRVALVTGANKGIGFEVARQLGRVGMTVLLGVRNIKLGEESAAKLRAEGFDVHAIEVDLSREETIQDAAASIGEKYGRIDVLVNNAGINDAADGPPSTADPGSVRRVFETNFFGTLAVTQAMLPFVRKAEAGRIVNLSSGLGSLKWNGDPEWAFAPYKFIGYNGSKAALNMMTVQLAYELRDTAIKVNSANPGFTATDMNGHQGTQTVEEGAAETVRLALLPADGPTGGFFETGAIDPW
jgi:NAD(P)-dependent dehydrogenase (short-subunit alcohol dehydrogenase family)